MLLFGSAALCCRRGARRAGRFAVEVVKTTNELESVVTIIVANDKQMPRRDPLRPLMEVRAVARPLEFGGPGQRTHRRCCGYWLMQAA